MKIAIYLGSFNPFHKGHLKVIKQAIDYKGFNIRGVIIVPTMQNPWKNENPISIDDRIKIISESLEGNFYPSDDPTLFWSHWGDRIEIDDIEKSLIPPYYSYATLHALKNKYCNDEIFILCGEDTIEDIPNWMHGGEILKDYNFLICDRTEESSTEIRNRVKNGESIKGLVSNNVIEMIENLYDKSN